MTDVFTKIALGAINLIVGQVGTAKRYRAVQVDDEGRLVLSPGAQIKTKNDPLFQPVDNAAVPADALANSLAPGALFRLLRVELHFGTAPTTSEDFTITVNAGDGPTYDVVIFRRDPSVGSLADIVVPFGEGFEFEADDELDAAFTNTDANTYGLRWVYELI